MRGAAKKKKPITSSVALWDALRARAGLQVSRRSKRFRSYDDDVLAELRSSLFDDQFGPFRTLLRKNNVSIEELLSKFLKAAAPFARMLTRVLQMYEAATASTRSENLQMVVQFDELAKSKLAFDLDSFRQQVKAFRTVTITRNGRGWTQNEMFGLSRDADLGDGSAALHRHSSKEMANWIAAYRNLHDFPALPPFSRLGVSWADEFLHELHVEMNEYLTRARELFGSYAKISFSRALPDDDEVEVWPAALVRQTASDYWPRQVMERLDEIVGRLVVDPSDESALDALRLAKSRFDALRTRSVTREEQIEELLDILNLPVWKRREAMYAVWVCAVALLDLREFDPVYHLKDGRLEFPFAATKIATIALPERAPEKIEFWSELRSPARTLLGKRKGAIQPDYRFRRVDGKGRATDALIIECKQYKKSNVGNFSSALIDYARASPSSAVILCNYGPVLASVIQRVTRIAPEVIPRVDALDKIRPEGDGEKRLRNVLRKWLENDIETPRAVGWTEHGEIRIELLWYASGMDLDLHVRQGKSWTNYKTPEGISGSRLDGDDRGDHNLMSVERIVIRPQGSSSYSIFVHRFSGHQPLAAVSPSITIFGKNTTELRLSHGSGDCWHVADLRPGFPDPVVVNKTMSALPDSD